MANRRRMYAPHFGKRNKFTATAPASSAGVMAAKVNVYDERGSLCAVPACIDCGRAAATPKQIKRHSQPLFPGPRCTACACQAYAKRTGWPGDPAAVEMQMIGDPNMRAVLSRPN